MKSNYTFKRIMALAIDWLVICVYLAVLALVMLSFYLLAFGEIPEMNQITSQLIATFTTVLPVIIFSTIYEIKSPYGSIGKKVMKLKTVHHKNKTISAIIRNILKFLPWQLGHMSVIDGIYGDFNHVYPLILYGLSIGLALLYVLQVVFTKKHQHLADVISNVTVVVI